MNKSGIVIAAAVVALVAGCSLETAPPKSSDAPKAAAEPSQAPSAAPSPSPSAGPVLKVGQTGTFDDVETDQYGENPKPVTKMSVTVKEAAYVTPDEVDAQEPEHGQYVRLTLTVKNTGTAPGTYAGYGALRWEDAQTAAQDATTLVIPDGPELDTTYKPGQSVTGVVVLDVARKGGTVTYWDSAATEAPAFSIALPSA
jgi:hypothetical protein